MKIIKQWRLKLLIVILNEQSLLSGSKNNGNNLNFNQHQTCCLCFLKSKSLVSINYLLFPFFFVV